ncbi:hypothetical protein DACRYDRAFT_114641 [Dacryopinax primogenitus]|uniref:VanZ-like domain-containing protein n=1 Tax=Dacryopinax primogenitus (strain DJM 731) TaxID=1858805 RepID=M5GFP2_DACPD|nr:uncharacterized protein DACRYDRAFT_114641 [Dacryopinax primogenitus]EJU04288.1 hypothetical protein DACRYDRAFT_114641 [Dacryopinax primogenitus]
MPPSDSISMSAGRRMPTRTRLVFRRIMRSQKFVLPNNYHLPIRLRPWFVIFTLVDMIFLAFLGFTNVVHDVPVNDKVMHFVCLGLATGLVYFIFDVEEDARRIWIWRNAGLFITGFLCFVLGGIVSEFVQGLLPYKTFQLGDIAANLLGSSLGLYLSWNLERYYRHRREIERLYQPLDVLEEPTDDEGDDTLPSFYTRQQPRAVTSLGVQRSRLADVWDEREEVFHLVDGEEDEAEPPKAGTAGKTR